MNSVLHDLNFEARDSVVLSQKIERFKSGGAAMLHVILDFDRTVTIGQPGHDDATSWQVLYQHLPPQAQDRYTQLYNHYRPLEVSGDMVEDDAIAWTSAVLDLYVEHKVNLSHVEEDFMSVVTLRPAARELLNLCKSHDIPVVILSAGLKNIIDILLRKHDTQAAFIIATALQTDENGVVTGWDPNTLVHLYNKQETGHAELESIRSTRPNCLLAGDSVSDANMVEGEDNIIRARIVDLRSDEVENAHAIQDETFPRFDVLDRSRSLQSVLRLVERIIAG